MPPLSPPSCSVVLRSQWVGLQLQPHSGPRKKNHWFFRDPPKPTQPMEVQYSSFMYRVLFHVPSVPWCAVCSTCDRSCLKPSLGGTWRFQLPVVHPLALVPLPLRNLASRVRSHPKISLGKNKVPNGPSPGIGTHFPLGRPSMSVCL